MSTVPFKQIPDNLRVPLFFAEVDNSRANSATVVQRTLIIGQITSAGTAVANVPVLSQGVADAATKGGQDSMLALMTSAYRAADNFGEVWYLPLADDPSATAAIGSFQFNTAPTVPGTLYIYVAGVRYALPVAPTQTVTNLASALAALLNADAKCPITATESVGTVTFTSVNKGPCGNDIDIRVNYGGALNGESTPTGLTYTITAMSGGATAPSLSSGLANLADQEFDFIVCPYTDTTSLDALKNFLGDSLGRWSWSVQLYGGFFAVKSGSLGSLTTFGASRNDQHGAVLGIYDSPTPSWIWAAALTGSAAQSIRVDPAMPLQTLTIPGVLAPPLSSRFQFSDRNALLFTGISTFTVGDDGTVRIENLITTYQKNSFGNPDNSYLQVETLYTLAYVLRFMRIAITSKFSRVKLAANGTRFASGANVVTPNAIRAELINQYRTLEYQGLVQGGDQFKDGLIVEQNASNPNRVDVLWPGVLINQLRIFALLAQFRLSVDQ